MKVTKEVKEQLEKIPALLFGLADSAIILATDLTKTGEAIAKGVKQMEVESD